MGWVGLHSHCGGTSFSKYFSLLFTLSFCPAITGLALWLRGADGRSSFPTSDRYTLSFKPVGLCSSLPGFCGPKWTQILRCDCRLRDGLRAAKTCSIQRYCLAHKCTVPVGLPGTDCPKRPPSWERSPTAISLSWMMLGRPLVHFRISLLKS